MADALAGVPDVVGVALGGSTARGTADASSDLDIGIYYRRSARPPLDALRDVAAELDPDGGRDAVTDYGEWGPWIDGGAWLTVEGVRVDWLYRDLDHVGPIVEACIAGRPEVHYQPGHPHGFHTQGYLGEIHHAALLHDPEAVLGRLKERVVRYPPLLRRALVEKFLWQAGFALSIAPKPAARGDVPYVAGCLFQSAMCLVLVLYALNERYFLNEKGSVAEASRFSLAPDGFAAIVRSVLAEPGADSAALLGSIRRLEELREVVANLCEEHVGGR